MNFRDFKQRQHEIEFIYNQVFTTIYQLVAITNRYNPSTFMSDHNNYIKYLARGWFYRDCHKVMNLTNDEIIYVILVRYFEKDIGIQIDKIVARDIHDFLFNEFHQLDYRTTHFFQTYMNQNKRL